MLSPLKHTCAISLPPISYSDGLFLISRLYKRFPLPISVLSFLSVSVFLPPTLFTYAFFHNVPFMSQRLSFDASRLCFLNFHFLNISCVSALAQKNILALQSKADILCHKFCFWSSLAWCILIVLSIRKFLGAETISSRPFCTVSPARV